MGILEQPGRGRIVVLALIGVGLAGASFATWFRVVRRPPAAADVARAVPGERDGVVVEVFNATPSVGLARTATARLRDAGLDVVYFGSEAGPALDSTEVLVRRGDAAAGARAARALGLGRVRLAPDPGRLVDVTIRLGRDFAARAAFGGNP